MYIICLVRYTGANYLTSLQILLMQMSTGPLIAMKLGQLSLAVDMTQFVCINKMPKGRSPLWLLLHTFFPWATHFRSTIKTYALYYLGRQSQACVKLLLYMYLGTLEEKINFCCSSCSKYFPSLTSDIKQYFHSFK